MSIWAQNLQQHIDASRQFQLSETDLLSVKKFWRDVRISDMEFRNQVDTGDLLLFKGKHFASKLQRSITRSQYDHVALLLRYGSGDVIMLQSTGVLGVGLLNWRTFVRNTWNQLYDQLVYRKLTCRRTDKIIDEVETFIKNRNNNIFDQYAVGKKYKFSASMIFKRKTDEKYQSEENPDRTFFCSELVAAVYKKMGILDQSVSSSNYWPGNFSSQRKLNLINGAQLSEEMLIDFSLK